MKFAFILGLFLILFGILSFFTGGFSFSRQKKDVDLGSVRISHKTQDTILISPLVSTIALLGGIALVVIGAKNR
jgi:uncharacterized membrane protein YidH (DUF202 family)